MDVLDKEYLSWISEQTKDNKTIYFFPGLNKDEKYALLETLFNKINEYVINNYYFNVDNFENDYCFRFGNEKFVITKHYGPDIIYSVRKDNKRLKYIDIDDIRKKTVRGRENLEVLYRMKTISLYLKELNKMGVPMDMVENATKREFSLIRHNNKRI